MSGRRVSAGRTALAYILWAALWIVLSDHVVEAVGIPVLQTYKGLAFVAVSAALLYLYLKRQIGNHAQAERMAERANESRSRLISAVSHDLRQPLQSLALFAEIIHQDRGLSPASRKAADHLSQSIERMGSLLNSILELSRLDQGTVSIDRRRTELGPLLQALAEEMRPQAEAKGLRLRVVECSAVVESDPTLLLTILRNLIANAIRYTDRGQIVVGCRRRGGQRLICVYDTGPGIAPEKMELIFEEFYQVANPSRDIRLGLGLGLSIVDRLCRLLGHRVVIHSVLERGSCFCVEVPTA